MVAGSDHGLPWRRAGRQQWFRLPVAIKKGGNYGPDAFFQNKTAGRVTLLLIMATSLHATRCAPCDDVPIIGNWIAQGWGLLDKGEEGRCDEIGA
jgi:hypothetical protein